MQALEWSGKYEKNLAGEQNQSWYVVMVKTEVETV